MQNVAVLEELTVQENIEYFCGLYIQDKKKRAELVKEAISFAGLENFKNFVPAKLSGGLLRRLNIACGVAHKPKLIILDEPTVAVDPQSRNRILEGIQELNRNGATIIYTSHYMEEVEQICTRIAIMDKGRVVASGTNAELKGMISAGEKITVELYVPDKMLPAQVKELPHVHSAEIIGNKLIVKSDSGKHSLPPLLDFLREKNTAYGAIYCELPTLNDVFLEITGTELRD